MTRVPIGTLRVGEKARRYVNEALDANRLSYGPFTRRFEELFAKLHGCERAVFCSSGTGALQVALQALKLRHGWADGDEVLVPAVTFVSTPNVVVHNRMTPVFVDVDRSTYNIDASLLEAKVTARTRAIMPVHLLGLPCDMAAVMDVARRRGLRVVEDSCETVFARFQGKPVGSFGDVGCFSTYVAHAIVSGIGGFATTSDLELERLMRSLVNHGRDPRYLSIDDNSADAADYRFRFLHHGHSFRATELEAALGLAQLEDKDELVSARLAVAEGWTRRLSPLAGKLQLPSVPAGREHRYMLYPLVTLGEPKDRLVRALEAAGVETRDLMPLVTQPLYASCFKEGFLNARWLAERAFAVACHQDVSPEMQDHAARLIERTL